MKEKDRSLYGDWMGSIYGPHGERTDWIFSLLPDGTFQKSEISSQHGTEEMVGIWSFDAVQEIMQLATEETPDDWELWSVEDITGCERANTMLILRAVRAASRNLPITLYRVHHMPHTR